MSTGFWRNLTYPLAIFRRSHNEDREISEDYESRESSGKAPSPPADRCSYFVAVLDHTLLGDFHGGVHPIQAVVRGRSTGRPARSESRFCRCLLPRRPLRSAGVALVHPAYPVVCKYGEARADALVAA